MLLSIVVIQVRGAMARDKLIIIIIMVKKKIRKR